jgi:tetratricopeptide (TPR) repeat protein
MSFKIRFNRIILALIACLLPATGNLPACAQNADLTGARQAADQAKVKELSSLIETASQELQSGKQDLSGASLKRAAKILNGVRVEHTSGVYSGVSSSQARSLHLQIAQGFAALNQDGDACQEFQKAISIQDAFCDYPDSAEECHAYAEFLQKRRRLPEAKKMEARSRCISKMSAYRDKFGIAGKESESEKLAREAVREASYPVEQKDLLLPALRKLARVLEARREYDRALECHRRRLALAEQENNQRQIAESLCDLGMLAEDRARFREAAKYYRESMAKSRAAGETGESYACQRLELLEKKLSK